MDSLLLAKAEELRRAGRRVFVWDRVSGRPIAAVSYALCLAEILDQMKALGDSVDIVSDGRNAFVLVEGPPGIGKTRFLSELVRYAKERELICLLEKCSPVGPPIVASRLPATCSGGM